MRYEMNILTCKKEKGKKEHPNQIVVKVNKTLMDAEKNKDEEQVLEIEGKLIKVSEFKKGQVLGQGSSGVVEKAFHEATGTVIGIKCIPLVTDPQFRQQLDQELNTLVQSDSQSIVKCYGAYIQKRTINIVLEYMDLGTVQDLVKKVGPLPEKIVAILAIQVLKGLDYIHNQKKVLHRDIKPSNLLVNSKGYVKIADFGASVSEEKAMETTNWSGTVMYMAPERFNGQACSFNSDIWSLGLTICECALGVYPYLDSRQYKTEENFQFWRLPEYFNSKDPSLPEDFSAEMKDFVSLCFKKSSQERMQSQDLLEHSMVKTFSKYNTTDFEQWILQKNIKPAIDQPILRFPTSNTAVNSNLSASGQIINQIPFIPSVPQNLRVSNINSSVSPFNNSAISTLSFHAEQEQQLLHNKDQNLSQLLNQPMFLDKLTSSTQFKEIKNPIIEPSSIKLSQQILSKDKPHKQIQLQDKQISIDRSISFSSSNGMHNFTQKKTNYLNPDDIQQQTSGSIEQFLDHKINQKNSYCKDDELNNQIKKLIEDQGVYLRQQVQNKLPEDQVDSFISSFMLRVQNRVLNQIHSTIKNEISIQYDHALTSISNHILSLALPFQSSASSFKDMHQVHKG